MSSRYGEDAHRWRTPAVADLAWAIGSPSLVDPSFTSVCEGVEPVISSDAWCRRQRQNMLPWLQDLDAAPEDFHALIASRRDRRLGAYFEDLLRFWLEASPDFEVIAHGLPVRGEGKTVGEFDFIVHNRTVDRFEHWEVAVKFYLGLTMDAPWQQWIGPGRKDTLGNKLDHLAGRQLRLAERPEAQQALASLGIHSVTPRVFLKGRLFYPTAAPGVMPDDVEAPQHVNPHHLTGWWCRESVFWHNGGGRHWQRLTKFDWLTAFEAREEGPESEFPLRFPVGVIGKNGEGEESRGFVVPERWPEPPTPPPPQDAPQ